MPNTDTPTPLRFVLLQHDWPEMHFDLFLEVPGEEFLLAWRVPPIWPLETAVSATPNHPHRKIYLEYEGPVPGDRGTVRRIVGGMAEAIADGFRLIHPNGVLELRANDRGDGNPGWTLAPQRTNGS
ncbi:MAG: hypothetical protein ACRCZF_02825 [Gemmataceae bacterium]